MGLWTPDFRLMALSDHQARPRVKFIAGAWAVAWNLDESISKSIGCNSWICWIFPLHAPRHTRRDDLATLYILCGRPHVETTPSSTRTLAHAQLLLSYLRRTSRPHALYSVRRPTPSLAAWRSASLFRSSARRIRSLAGTWRRSTVSLSRLGCLCTASASRISTSGFSIAT